MGHRSGQAVAGVGVTDEQPRACTLTLDQFITQFYQGALHRAPTQTELDQWKASLGQAQAQGFAPLFAQAQALGNALFATPPYAFVSNTAFVTDLYWAYLQRTPDSGGLSSWVGLLDNEQATREQV